MTAQDATAHDWPPEQSVFAAASPQLLAAVARAAVSMAAPSGAVLFSQGDAADAFYIIDDGEIEISVMSQGGRKLTLEIMTAGEVFGEIGLFAGTRTATATVSAAARLRRVRRSDLMASIRDEPALALQFIDMLCARLRVVGRMLEERTFLPLPTRIAGRLLHLERKVGSVDGVIAVSQADLADFAGATREAVAKTLAGWRARGWIALRRGAVTITDRAALEMLADSADE